VTIVVQVTIIKSSPELRVYDFGGHAEQYATHTFFLSKRCVFLLVINLHAPDHADINYWLQQITATAAPYKLIIVFTHVDLFHDDGSVEQAWLNLSRTVIRRFAHCMHERCMVSTVTRAGVQRLREIIVECAVMLSRSQQQLQCELKFEQAMVCVLWIALRADSRCVVADRSQNSRRVDNAVVRVRPVGGSVFDHARLPA
jgi:hypothetical protein